MKNIMKDLTAIIRQNQLFIDKTIKNKSEYFIYLHELNEKLIQFERLFIIDKTSK